MSDAPLGTQAKALAINLEPAQYGAFAEIGAGQEVARWFFRVGGAAGTVAKTISAYDKSVSDHRYGPVDRYVSRRRLEAMLAQEYARLVDEIGPTRGEHTTFFAFADTVATRSYSRQEDGDGWLGIRFQTAPRGEPSDILIHVRLHDKESVREQEALGVLGVNLVYGAFHHHADPEALIGSLLDSLTRERVDVDMLRFSGPAFAGVDNRLTSLKLVETGLADATMFTADGEVVHPSELLYGRPVLVERGSFRPATTLTLHMLERAREQFASDVAAEGAEPVVLMEMTLRNLAEGGGIDYADFLARVEILRALGNSVLISNFGLYFHLVEYLARVTKKSIGLALGVPSLREIGDEKYYVDLPGGLLEAMGRLFRSNVKVYVHPYRDPVSGGIVTLETAPSRPRFRHLKAFLLEGGHLAAISGYAEDLLALSPPDVLAMIQSGDPAWEAMVPSPVVATIKRERLFGYRDPEPHIDTE